MNVPEKNLDSLPEAEVRDTRHRLPMVWLVPLVALAIGAWLVYKNLSEQGPTIHIQFQNAEGIEPGKTKIKYRNVQVGLVNEVTFAEDLSHVLVSAEMDLSTKPHLTTSTRFWVVRPRIDAMRISGVGTLLSGAYIAMDVDVDKPGKFTHRFTGLEEPPNILADTPGTSYLLQADDLGSLSVGSPLFYRKIKVGSVTRQRLADDHTHVIIDIFVHAPHDRYIRRSTRFWNASGIDIDFSAQGLKVDMESLLSLMAGGVAFETPNLEQPGEQAPADTVFTLFDNRKQARERPITVKIPFVLHFNDSVRGLSVGAPVEFRGIRIGTVTDIRVSGSLRDNDANDYITVMIELEPQRIEFGREIDWGGREQQAKEARRMAEDWAAAGVRARLQTGSLLTGKLFVEFDIHPDAAPAQVVYQNGLPVLPSLPGQLKGLTDSASRILAKLESLPIEEIGHNLERATAGADRLINSTELRGVVRGLDSTLKQTNVLLAELSRASGEVQPLISSSIATVTQAQETLKAVEGMATNEGPVGSQLLQALHEISATFRSLRALTDYLQRHPEALFKGKRLR